MPVKYLCFGLALLLSFNAFCNELITIKINDTEFTFSNIPAGRFIMGDPEGHRDELPLHPVNINSFYLQTNEVTIRQYSVFNSFSDEESKKGCWYFQTDWQYSADLDWRNPGYPQTNDHPVVCVSWTDVQLYIEQLNTHSQHEFRLPTEAEWEYATRANSTTRFYWGNEPAGLCSHANASDLQTLKKFPSFKSNRCDDGFLETAPVKSYIANPHGLFDVYGNVWEWTQDCWNNSYINAPADGAAWLTGDCSRRIFRGGGWGDNPKFARSSLRNRAKSNQRKDDIGFRLVVIPNQPKK